VASGCPVSSCRRVALIQFLDRACFGSLLRSFIMISIAIQLATELATQVATFIATIPNGGW